MRIVIPGLDRRPLKVTWNDSRKVLRKALWKKKMLRKMRIKKNKKIPKGHLRGWITSPCVATLNRRRRICRRLAVGTRLSWQEKLVKSYARWVRTAIVLLFSIVSRWLINEFALFLIVCERINDTCKHQEAFFAAVLWPFKLEQFKE